MREEYAAAGPDVILSSALCESLTARLAVGEQAIVLLNRRGFATSVVCRQCGSTLECPNCSLSLTVHRAARRARCHYCNYAIPVPKACVKCCWRIPRAGRLRHRAGRGGDPRQVSRSTESTASIATPFAGAARSPRCSARFAAGELDILVGTQMLAKGHDFPKVTLVGVISADVGLGLADFRAGERTFQLLTQVAGRAGPRRDPGRGDRADAVSGPLQHPPRLPSGLRRVLPGGDPVPAVDAVSAGRRPDQRRRAIADVRRGDAGCR